MAVATAIVLAILKSWVGTIPLSDQIVWSRDSTGTTYITLPFTVSWWWHVAVWAILSFNAMWLTTSSVYLQGEVNELFNRYLDLSVFGLVFGLGFELVYGLSFGLSFGLVYGLSFGLSFGLVFGLVFGRGAGLVFGLVFGFCISITLCWLFGPAVGLPLAVLPWIVIGVYQLMRAGDMSTNKPT